MRASAELGAFGERVAERHLVAAGFVIVDRNWRCRAGEIDIVALDGDVVVVCEVKTRTGDAYGSPLDAVTPAKARRLRQLAGLWLRQSPLHPASIRIDVVAVMCPPGGNPGVEHLRGVD
jgi:putative endonuclease